MNRKRWKRLIIGLLVIPVLIFAIIISILYTKQDAIVQELITTLNADFNGEVVIRDSHISPFANFPYISIDLDDLKLYESKSKYDTPIIDVKDVYLGFDLFTLLSGKMDIKSIKVSNGKIHIVQKINGKFNIVEALASKKPIENTEDEFHLDLKSIQLENVDITKINEENLITIEFFINDFKSKLKTSPDHLIASIDSKFLVNVIKDKDTTFFKHKHVVFSSSVDVDKKQNKMIINPSEFDLEHAEFDFEGSIDFENHSNIDLVLKGRKSNFEIFLAMAPEELIPVLSKYDNKGEIFFLATLKGQIANGQMPKIDVDFNCKNAFLYNTLTDKKLDELNFKAHFTTGALKKLESMEFSLTDFTSRPEAGFFKGHLIVKNFAAPEIDTRIISDFDLDFLSKFLNVSDVENLKGKVKLTMNFKDIIDFNHPEKAIEKLKESYFTELQVTDLSFKTKYFHLPVDKLNINATLVGHVATIKQFELKTGKSDLKISGSISDLPAIIHHTNDLVKANLNIRSTFLDLEQLTSHDTANSKPVDEQIENLNMDFAFKSTARAFTESPNLPIGEFFIDNLYGKMKHYPHTLHDFHADVLIDSSDFRIIDFNGMIDKSDFHFVGKLVHYDLWFMDVSRGDTKLEFDLTSKLLQLEDVFSYKGENYVPEDYRHEEFRDLKLHGHAALHFKDSLISTDMYLDQFQSQMKVHKYKIEKFKGRIHYEDDHLMVTDFSGKLGKSSFEIDLNYYFGKDEKIKKRDNHFGIVAAHLDFDELFAFNPSPKEVAAASTAKPADHEKGFNIYEVPFTDMTYDLQIDHLNYHRYLINNIKGKMRTTPNHYLYIDTLMLLAADGKINMNGYFNGSNKDKIYFSPDMKLQNVDLDKLLFKFENFGQDHIVSENVHGKLSGRITGKLHMHRDMVPIIDDSELHIDIEVTEGKLEKYAPLNAMSDYFKDKNLAKVLFDTLKNHIDVNKGLMSFPMMTINSSLGFIEVSGKQDLNSNMEYYIRVPLKLVTGVAKQKLFGTMKDEEIDANKDDEIIYKNNSEKIRYVNLKITGNSDNYKISLAKEKNGKGNKG
jgi:hypothetical protein